MTKHPRITYPHVLDINYFCHFLNLLENFNPMDDEPIWAADCVVAPTPGPVITIPETANDFVILGNHLTLVKGNQFDGRIKTDPHKHIHEFLDVCDMFKYGETKNEVVPLMMFPLSLMGEAKTWLDELNEGTIESWDELHMLRNCHGHNLTKGNIIKIFYHGLNKTIQEALDVTVGGIFSYKTPNQAYQLLEDKVLLKLDWTKNQKPKPSLKKTIAFADEGNSNSDTNKIMTRVDAMTMKMNAQYKEIQFGAKCNHYGDLGASINLMPYSLYAKLSLETLKPTKMSVRLVDRSFQYPIGIAENMLVKVGKFTFHVDFIILKMEEDSKVPLVLGRLFLHTADAVICVKQEQLNLGIGTKRMTFSIDSAKKRSYYNDDTCFCIDV
ncbi:reverse transcriptase domain-containing protein [Tanacetum coccineum]